MADIITTLPVELATWRPTLRPGSMDAELAGCTCPEAQHLWPGALTFDDACPVHTEAVRNGWMKYLNMKVQF